MGQWMQFDDWQRKHELSYDYLPVVIEEPEPDANEKEQKPLWHMRARQDGSCPRKHNHQPGQPSRQCRCFCTFCRGEK
jgi:hypothetical protein